MFANADAIARLWMGSSRCVSGARLEQLTAPEGEPRSHEPFDYMKLLGFFSKTECSPTHSSRTESKLLIVDLAKGEVARRCRPGMAVRVWSSAASSFRWMMEAILAGSRRLSIRTLLLVVGDPFGSCSWLAYAGRQGHRPTGKARHFQQQCPGVAMNSTLQAADVLHRFQK